MPTYPRISQLRKDFPLDDEKAPGVALESDATTARHLFESLASQISRMLDATGNGNWYDDIPEVNSKKRGLLQLATDLDAAQDHENLDTLTHALAEDNFTELTYSGDNLTTVITWQTAAKLTKIREVTLSYTGDLVTGVTTVQYDNSGNALTTLTKTLTYDVSENLETTTTVRT